MLALRVGDRDSRADRPASLPARQPASSPSSRRLGMRGRQSPGAGRCITAPGKVSGSRRFYVIILVPLGAVAPTTADAPKRSNTAGGE
jgi:hypothetical protein